MAFQPRPGWERVDVFLSLLLREYTKAFLATRHFRRRVNHRPAGHGPGVGAAVTFQLLVFADNFITGLNPVKVILP
jgi:hypothetical protein